MESANDPIASPETPTHGSNPALSECVPADAAPSLISVVADAVPTTDLQLRARLLQRLLIPIGPLAMTVLAGGAFAKYVEFARRLPPISVEDAGRVTSGQAAEIAGYLEQSDPIVLEQVVVALSHDPAAMAALGASVAAIAVKLASARLRRAPTEAAKLPGTISGLHAS